MQKVNRHTLKISVCYDHQMKHKQHTKPKERTNKMSKIIQFPTKEQTISNGYKNLVALFEVCSSKECCDFYLSTAEELFRNRVATIPDASQQKKKEINLHRI